MAIIGLTVRNSTARQVGNFRAAAQGDMAGRLAERGHQARIYDEQGTSGADLSKRKMAMQMLDDLKHGVIQGIAAYDVKRLTRDEFGIDGGTIARRIVEAGGLFITWDREYDLRNDDDLLQFQFQCFIAGIDWRNIRNTFWSGIFKKLEQEPMYMKPPLGYRTVTDDADKKHVAKHPEQAPVLAELARLFDAYDSLGDVVRHLNQHGPARPFFRGRGGTSTRWTVYGVRYILANPIYIGIFVFGRNLKKRSNVWHKFATDPSGLPKDFAQHVPDLAYWDAAQVRRWQKKFSRPSNARVPKSGRVHPLLGVLHCQECGSRMIGHGSDTYACSASGSGRATGGKPCPRPQHLTGTIAMQLLRRVLPEAMSNVQEIAAALRADVKAREPSAAEQRLAFLRERTASISEQMMGLLGRIPEELAKKLAEADEEIQLLQSEVTAEQDARLADEDLARVCEVILAEPIAVIDALPLEQQARLYRQLFRDVRIESVGYGAAVRWRLGQYRAVFGGALRVTADEAPWGYRPNPKRYGKLGITSAAGAVWFDTATPAFVEQTGASDISLQEYAHYTTSLSGLAAALSLVAA